MIRKVERADIPECVRVIRDSFLSRPSETAVPTPTVKIRLPR